jgi:hypothetical protein
MQKTVRKRLAVVVGALGLAACDPASPPEDAVSRPVEPQAPEAAVSRLVELPEAEVRLSVDPAENAAAEAIAQAMRDPDPFARARKLAVLLPSLGPEGVPGAKQMLRDPMFLPDRGGAEIELLARFWASHEPENATRWALDEAPSGYRLSSIFSALSQWAAVDPQSALVAVREWEKKQPGESNLVHIALVHGWFGRDPGELAQHIRQEGVGVGRQRKLSNYIRLLVVRQGTEAAMRWAESVPEGDVLYKQQVTRQTGAALVAFDVEAALRWCEAHCEGPYGEGLRNVIASRWAQLDEGVAALEWLLSEPRGEDWIASLKGAFGTWARRHPEAASAWMKTQARAGDADPEPWLQSLLPIYVPIVMREESPAEALAWAERIEKEGERERLLVRVARAWRWQDEAAAEAWLRESPLSGEARENARLLPTVGDRLPRE